MQRGHPAQVLRGARATPCSVRAGFAVVYRGWPAARSGKWIALLVFALAIIATCTSFYAMKEVCAAHSAHP